MDLSGTIQPKSDQLNFDDLLAGAVTVTVAEVRVVNDPKQPVQVHLVEFPGRPYKPNLTFRRVLTKLWGKDGAAYAGRRMTLYGEPTVLWAGKEQGGIRISHLSHITESVTLPLTITRGKREPHVVHPLPTVAPALDEAVLLEWVAAMSGAVDMTDLQSVWAAAGTAGASRDQRVIDAKDQRKQELSDA